MRNYLLILLVMVFCMLISKAQFIIHNNIVPPSHLHKPKVGIPCFDPRFGSIVTRISSSNEFEEGGIFPNSFTKSAWNVNDSLLLLHTGNGYYKLYHAKDYTLIKPIFEITGKEVFWHPNKADEIIFLCDNYIYTYSISHEQISQLACFAKYDRIYTGGHGHFSTDGKYFAFVAEKLDSESRKEKSRDLVVYDVQKHKMLSKKVIPKYINEIQWISVSPKGNYVVVNYGDNAYGNFHGLEVYDENLNSLWQCPLDSGSAGLAIDINNHEVLIMAVKDTCIDSTYIMKFRLKDGKETKLFSLPSKFDIQISCNKNGSSESCFISTLSKPLSNPENWMPFEDEIFALKLDGSQEIERIAHHNGRNTFSQFDSDLQGKINLAFAISINYGGNKIVFGSNWGRDSTQDQNVSLDSYVVDFSEHLSWRQSPKQSQVIDSLLASHKDAPIYDACGKEDFEGIEMEDTFGKEPSLITLPCDIYCLTIMGNMGIESLIKK